MHWLWRFGKSLVRSIESAEGILVIDDTVEEKAHCITAFIGIIAKIAL